MCACVCLVQKPTLGIFPREVSTYFLKQSLLLADCLISPRDPLCVIPHYCTQLFWTQSLILASQTFHGWTQLPSLRFLSLLIICTLSSHVSLFSLNFYLKSNIRILHLGVYSKKAGTLFVMWYLKSPVHSSFADNRPKMGTTHVSTDWQMAKQKRHLIHAMEYNSVMKRKRGILQHAMVWCDSPTSVYLL